MSIDLTPDQREAVDAYADHVRWLAESGLHGVTANGSELLDAMYFDKKVHGGKLRFILPDRIGHVVIRNDVPRELVAQAIEHIRG